MAKTISGQTAAIHIAQSCSPCRQTVAINISRQTVAINISRRTVAINIAQSCSPCAQIAARKICDKILL